MLNRLQKAKQKWGGKSDTVDNWLKSRQALLISYCNLAGISTEASTDIGGADIQIHRSQNALPDVSQIERFCEDLMDYLSAGHFEVYDMLIDGDDEGQELKQQLDPALAGTTDAALHFNDKYTEMVQPEQAASFDQDLEKLGETLAERFELEDQLISHMHQAVTE